MTRLWSKLMANIGDFLWLTFFLLIGAGLMALFFLTYFIPKRDSLRELVRTQQAELFRAKVVFAKERRDRLIKDRLEELRRRSQELGGAAGGNEFLKGEDK